MRVRRLSSLEDELEPPLSTHEASVESDRCYFCYDAPCITACPTGIDIPLFIRQISSANPNGAAATIFTENIFGGMCARVCPTETLCEQACVRNTHDQAPVRIGELQRYATDSLMETGQQPFERAKNSGRRVAIVGAGPAGIACAHRLALHGHEVVIFESRSKPAGLNEYGIAAYKTVANFAQREIDYILSIGGIRIEYDKTLGVDITIAELKNHYDCVFIAIGLACVNALVLAESPSGQAGLPSLTGVNDAIDFIASIRQLNSSEKPKAGRRVVVIGGGMTAIDAAVQARLLGAEDATVVYRRGFAQMNASEHEQQLAQANGVLIKTGLQPVRLVADASGKHVAAVEFEQTDENLQPTGERRMMSCDRVLLAIGQKLQADLFPAAIETSNGKIVTDSQGRTSDSKVWAGGDCTGRDQDLTVAAVQSAKVAAEAMHAALTAQTPGGA